MTNGLKRELVKILYVIPEGEEDAGKSESLWAYSLGNQLYELQNIPVFAEHLNVEDIVLCDEPPNSIPIINVLSKPSGNRTLRVIFTNEVPDDECSNIVRELVQREILYETPIQKRYMFNVEPRNDYEWAVSFLRSKEEAGLLWLYEQ